MDVRKKLSAESFLMQKKFISRQNEQKVFAESFQYVLSKQNTSLPSSRSVSRLFLVNGQGGLGKTTLLSRFIQICRDVDQTLEALVVKIDWSEYQIDEGLEEVEKAVKVMDVLHDILTPKYDPYFKEYRAKRERHEQISQEKAQAIPEFDGWVDFTSDLVAATPAGPLGKAAFKAIAKTAVPEILEQRRRFSDWFRRKLHPEDYDLYDDPKGQLSRLFVQALLEITHERPLVLLFDTAEHVLHVHWLRTGLIKYTIPETERILLVIAGRITDPERMSIRDAIPDSFIYSTNLDTFSKFDITHYLKVCQDYKSENDVSSKLVDFVQQTTHGVPLAVDLVVTALSKGYDWVKGDHNAEGDSFDAEEIIGQVAYRFLKHCLDDPKKLSDRDYIYTFAVLPDEIKDGSPTVDYIWRKIFGEQIRTADTIRRLQQEYSFIFSGGKMHHVVKLFVCSALHGGKIDIGRLYEINRAALDYFSTKMGSFKEYRTKFRNGVYQEAAIGYLNHLFWLGDIDSGLDFLCNIYNLSILYGQFAFANRFLSIITSNQWLRVRLPKEEDELLTSLQYFGHLLGHYGQTPPTVATLKELIFKRLDKDTKTLTLLDEAVKYAKAGKIRSAAKAIKQAEALVSENAFAEEMAQAYRMLGIATRRQGNLDAALNYLDKAYSLKSDAYTLVELGRTKSQKHLKDEAIGDFLKALEIDPSMDYVRKEIEHLSKSGHSIADKLEYQIQQCYSSLEDLGKTNQSQSYYRIHSRLSRLLRKQGKLEAALQERLIAEPGFSNLACTYNKTSAVYLLLGDYEKALQKANKAREIGDDNPGTYLSLGDVYRAMDQNLEAQSYYDLAIKEAKYHKKDSKSLFVQKEGAYGKGVVFLLLGDLEAGIQNIDQAQRLMQHPQVTEDPQVLNALGIALLLTNRPRRAEDLFKQSIKLCDEIVAQSPSGYEAYYHKMIA